MTYKSQDALPRTAYEAIEGMALRFNSDEAKDLEVTIQFNVSPSTSIETGGDYYLSIADGKCGFSTGITPDPTLTISTPTDVWLKIARKEISGPVALMTGKYRAHGQMGLLIKMDKLFSRQPLEAELAEKGWR